MDYFLDASVFITDLGYMFGNIERGKNYWRTFSCFGSLEGSNLPGGDISDNMDINITTINIHFRIETYSIPLYCDL